jgi:hypothetical protein
LGSIAAGENVKSSKLIVELETSVTPIATFVGSVSGMLIVLAPVTAAIVFIGRWSHWGGLALSFFVFLGTLSAAIDAIGAIKMRVEAGVTVSANSVRQLICIKLIQLLLFVSSLATIYCFLI